jgi:hypothetical protein
VSLEFHPLSDFVGVVGRKASGKTIYTKFLLKMIRRKVLIDPTWQFKDLGYIIHFLDKQRIVTAFKEWHSVVFQPKHMTAEVYEECFSQCLQLSNYTLGVDEIDKFARPRWYITEYLHEVINRGRHQGIGLICNSRRPAMMHNDIRSNADYVVCFHLHEERDVKYMSDWMNVSEETIKNLPTYHSLLFNVKDHSVTEQLPCKLV